MAGDAPPAEPAEPSAPSAPSAAPPSLERRPSRIARFGVFAAEPLAAGVAIDAELNHSCDPNVWFDGATMVTRGAVESGDELTYDYATDHADPGFVLWCHCETYRCRQVIEGTDWKIPQLRQRYCDHWAPELQKLIDADG